jgi:hypothetical protein
VWFCKINAQINYEIVFVIKKKKKQGQQHKMEEILKKIMEM